MGCEQSGTILYISYHYSPPYYSGKLIKSCSRLREIAKAGKEVVVYTSGLQGYPNSEVSDNIHIYRSPFFGNGKISKRLNVVIFWFWSLIKLIFEQDVSVVHFDENKGISVPLIPGFGKYSCWIHFWLLAEICRKRKIRTVFEHAISDRDGDFIFYTYKKKFFDCVDKIVSVSDALHEAVYQVYPQKAHKIVNGVKVNLFKPLESSERQLFREEQGLDRQAIIFCFVGMVNYRKGFDLISQVFGDIVDEFPNAVLWCIGPYREIESEHVHNEEISKYIKVLEPVQKHVKFWGKIDDRQYLSRVIGSADIFVFPTRREGMPRAPLEAMACGLPLIISRIPGVTDLASIEGKTGLYIPPGNAEELRIAMRKLAADQNLREQMGKMARARVEEAFTWREHVAQWADLYGGQFEEGVTRE